MPWHCEMGGQSKTIKSLDSGQGLGDPSPQGDPDNHQILLFKRWHVYKLFKPLSLFGLSETQGFCLLHTVDLLPFFCESVNWLASLSVFLQELDRMWRYTLILIRADCLCICVSSSLRNFYQIQQWKHEEFGREKKQAATTLNCKCSDRVKLWNIRVKWQNNIINVVNQTNFNAHSVTFNMVWG